MPFESVNLREENERLRKRLAEYEPPNSKPLSLQEGSVISDVDAVLAGIDTLQSYVDRFNAVMFDRGNEAGHAPAPTFVADRLSYARIRIADLCGEMATINRSFGVPDMPHSPPKR